MPVPVSVRCDFCGVTLELPTRPRSLAELDAYVAKQGWVAAPADRLRIVGLPTNGTLHFCPVCKSQPVDALLIRRRY